jgi:hypothetical protein
MQNKIKEFDKAKELIVLMSSASNLEEYEEHWKEFLHKLDRGFNKLRDLYKNEKRAQQILNSIYKARTSDPLIAYLMQARNSDEHSMHQITEKMDGYTKIIGGAGGGTIDSGVIEGGMRPSNLKFKGNLEVQFQAEYLSIIPIISRGQRYDPPNICFGENVSSQIPHQIAIIGLNFYIQKMVMIEKVTSP